MMKNFKAPLVALLLLLPLGSWGADPKLDGRMEWKQKMSRLGKVLSELLADLAGTEEPKGAERKRIQGNARALAELAHGIEKASLKKMEPAPDADPSVAMVAGMFASEARRASEALSRGDNGYARGVLKSLPGHCIACHTRDGAGVRLDALPEPASFSKMSLYERAEYHAATRQFDRALGEFEEILANPKLGRGQLEWERAVRYALALAVRVKEDPDRAYAIVERVLASPRTPQFMKEDAQSWKESVLKWKAEIPRTPTGEEGLFAEAGRLMALARETQKYPVDRAADIIYLRASSVAHRLLREAPNGRRAPEAFLVAGMSYEVLADFGIWTLHEMFYEACIRKAPHTEVARACYRRIEESVYAGFTGSGGSHVPPSELRRLAELDSLAQEKPQERN